MIGLEDDMWIFVAGLWVQAIFGGNYALEAIAAANQPTEVERLGQCEAEMSPAQLAID